MPESSKTAGPAIPSDNTWHATATFDAPGTYTLRGIAHDGGLSTVKDVVVTVTK